MMSTDRQTGGCLCGAVRFTAPAEANWVAHCHCESCRRAVGAPLTSWAGFDEGAVRFDGAAPGDFESSPGTHRLFCGTSLGMSSASRHPGEFFVLLGVFDEPAAYRPVDHVHVDEKIAWLRLADGLPQHSGPDPVRPGTRSQGEA